MYLHVNACPQSLSYSWEPYFYQGRLLAGGNPPQSHPKRPPDKVDHGGHQDVLGVPSYCLREGFKNEVKCDLFRTRVGGGGGEPVRGHTP